MLNNIFVVIPAYQPDEDLAEFLRAILPHGYGGIVVVDDGSTTDVPTLLGDVRKDERVIVLTHPRNMGKGAALKTAFRFLLARRPAMVGVVTTDSDGQHSPGDVLRVANALAENPESLCLGTRVLMSEAPFRSRFGNSLTKRLSALLTGKHILDTQTGLRGIPVSMLGSLMDFQADRYDFEMGMILQACRDKVDIKEIGVATVYKDGNALSHFRILRDSFLIYRLLLTYAFRRLFRRSAASHGI